jgi:hypothetical protein
MNLLCIDVIDSSMQILFDFRSTICKLGNDILAMKKLAGCNFENLLQVHIVYCVVFLYVTIPCFKGLCPQPCKRAILDLLFVFTTWHALAKLHLHTMSSLSFFKSCTKTLSQVLQYFHDHVCLRYKTHEHLEKQLPNSAMRQQGLPRMVMMKMT